jgi:diguanylate cyclase (GGDEF)-like protein/putative nucleotidyltransferase with HDIG domain
LDALRTGLAACTVILLGVACLVALRSSERPRHHASLPAKPALLLYPLLAGLSVALVFRPGIEVGPVPVGQVVLLFVAAALFMLTVSVRTQVSSSDARLFDSATVDALTRIASHRVFQDRLAHECDRAYRFGDTFTLLMLDLDNFRPINERHGHRVGDRVLLELSRKFRGQLRDIDLVARFGGDQFAMILPHTFEKGGVEVAERLRRAIAAWVFPVSTSADVRLTLSIGMCSYPQDGISPSEMIDAAEKALAFAKALGGNQVHLAGDLPAREQVGNVVSLPHSGREAIVRSLAAAVDVRDGYTREHSRLVSELSAAIARRIGLPGTDVARISVGALLHDVGKIGVPDAILAKEGKLSAEEWDCIREHPGLGKRIVEQAPELMDVVPLVFHHQEHWDGTGYPAQLRGEDIPLGARIIAAADAYHAMRSDRPYRSGRTHREAMRELLRQSGEQFDPRVVEALLAVLDNDAELRALATQESDPPAPKPATSVAVTPEKQAASK